MSYFILSDVPDEGIVTGDGGEVCNISGGGYWTGAAEETSWDREMGGVVNERMIRVFEYPVLGHLQRSRL